MFAQPLYLSSWVSKHKPQESSDSWRPQDLQEPKANLDVSCAQDTKNSDIWILGYAQESGDSWRPEHAPDFSLRVLDKIKQFLKL